MLKFTIITCTFNAQDVLQRTLDSVAEQTWDLVEHLIIDGASRDATKAIAERYQKAETAGDSGHEVVVVSEPDKGLYDAMNKGIARATGDYIVFLNAGDVLHSPTTLADIFAFVNERSDGLLPAVLYGDTDIVDEDGKFVCHRRLAPPDDLNWKSFMHGMLVCHQAFYVRTDIAREEPYDLRYRFSADVDWCIRVMKHAEKLRLTLLRIPEVVADYLYGGMTNRNHRASLMERFSVMRRHYGLMRTLAMHAWFAVRALLK